MTRDAIRRRAFAIAIALAIGGLGTAIAALATGEGRDPLPADARADRILIEKSSGMMTLFRDGRPLRAYLVAFGRGSLAPKAREGDGRTPEGRYRIDRRNVQSRYHRALHISYPEPRDVAAAQSRGVSPGGDIMIHGLPNGLGWLGSLHRMVDWTAGCIAVTNAEIEEIWRVVPDGTAIEIRP